MINIQQRRMATGVFSVVASYAVFAGLWILLSDQALGLLIRDPAELVRISMVKGWLFVAVTSLLLYGLVRRLVHALTEAHQRELMFERERQQPPPMLVAIADASSDAIFAKDMQGRYLLFNNAASCFVGLPFEQVLGQDDRAIFPPEQAALLMAIDARIRHHGGTETTEERLHTIHGERVFSATLGPLHGADGQIFGTYGIARDITSRKREEESLRSLAEDLETTLQAVPDLMFEMDAQGHYLKVKAADQALLAVLSPAWIGHTVHDVLPAEAASVVMTALAAASMTGSDYGRTFMLPLEAGPRFFELSVARRPVVPNQPDRFIVLSRDTTVRVAAEAELRCRYNELERFNRMAIDRELRMVALKQEVNALALAVGRPAPYDTAFSELATPPKAL